jgi:cyclomaltodextrinase / maltogenic alpha-amylase / neopullulanase
MAQNLDWKESGKMASSIKSDLNIQKIKPGKYRHYKGKEYEVIGIAKHSENLEDFVVYRALYGDGQLWIRPCEMFLESIIFEGRKISRFEYVNE